MYLTAMTHRDELFDLTLRWLNDKFEVEDGAVVTKIFYYESAILAVVVDRVFRLLEKIFQQPLHTERVHQKQRLRERIIQYLLALASAPVVHVPELSGKMYGRYLPETIVTEKCALFGFQIDGGLLNTFCLNADCLSGFCLLHSACHSPTTASPLEVNHDI